jgi:hypothetical protein
LNLADDEYEEQIEMYKKMSDIARSMDFDEEKQILKIKVDEEKSHNTIIQFVDLKIYQTDWILIKEKVFEQVDKKFKVGQYSKLNLELLNKNVTFSNVIYCKINYINLKEKKYKSILIYLYKLIIIKNNGKEKILKNTHLNISEDVINNKGYKYYNDLKLSVQGADANKTLEEIINFSKLEKNKLEIKIKLKNGEEFFLSI